MERLAGQGRAFVISPDINMYETGFLDCIDQPDNSGVDDAGVTFTRGFVRWDRSPERVSLVNVDENLLAEVSLR